MQRLSAGIFLVIVFIALAMMAIGCASEPPPRDPTAATGTEIDKTIVHFNSIAALNQQIRPHADDVGDELLDVQLRDTVDGKATSIKAAMELRKVAVENDELHHRLLASELKIIDMKESRRWRWGGYCEWAMRIAVAWLVIVTIGPLIARLLNGWAGGIPSMLIRYAIKGLNFTAWGQSLDDGIRIKEALHTPAPHGGPDL